LKLNRIIISFAIGILITNIVGIAINIIYGSTENYFEVTAKVWEKGYKPLKAFIIQYVLVIPVALLVAYLCFWMQHTFNGFIIYYIIYTIIYIIVQYLVYLYTKNASKN